MAANFINTSGNIIANSGNFTTLTINGTSINNFNENIDDRINSLLVAGTGINLSYNDNSNALTINLASSVVSGYEVLSSGKSIFTVSQGYLSNNLNVYVNGSKLILGEDYTASNGSTFTLTQTAASGDIIEWQGLGGPAAYSELNHTHSSSDITNFNSSVSGLLPTIANSGDNRILTSTGSSVGINAESNLTFNGSLLNVVGSGSFSSQTVFASGTAAAPGISIIGDTDTGIAQLIRGGESANTLSLVVGGTERMRIEPGNVKILTPTDDTAEFSISNSIDRDAYVVIDGGSNAGRSAILEGRSNGVQEWYICSTRFHEDGPNNGMALNVAGSNPMTFRTNNTEKMRITSAGSVGIGTSSPSALLEVAGSSKFTGAATFTISSGSSVPISIINSGSGNSLVVATNFIVDGSGRLGLFGAPRSFEACSVLGTAPSSSQASLGFRVQCTYPSSTTTDAASFSSFPTTQAASYTLTNLYHFGAFQQAFGAGSTVTNQYGLFVDSTLTGATNNYAVYTGIASGTGRWAIYAAGTAASYFGGQVQISAGSGSSGSYKPGVAVSGDDDTGLQQVGGANTISLVTAGGERVRVDASGNVGIGGAPFYALDVQRTSANAILNVQTTTSGNAQLRIECAGNASSTITQNRTSNNLEITNGSTGSIVFTNNGSERMSIANDGVVKMNDVYGDTVGATNRDLFIDDTGKLGYVSSIRASKTNIAAIDDVTWLRDLTPVSFFYRRRNEDGTYSDEPDGTLDYGLIAEDVEVVAPELCFYDIVDDNPELRGVHYSKLITPMLKYIQQLEDRIASLETRLGDNV